MRNFTLLGFKWAALSVKIARVTVSSVKVKINLPYIWSLQILLSTGYGHSSTIMFTSFTHLLSISWFTVCCNVGPRETVTQYHSRASAMMTDQKVENPRFGGAQDNFLCWSARVKVILIAKHM